MNQYIDHQHIDIRYLQIECIYIGIVVHSGAIASDAQSSPLVAVSHHIQNILAWD